MAGVKETPTNFRVYYTSMKNAYTQKRDEAVKLLESLHKKGNELREYIDKDFITNKKEYNIDLTKYQEYNDNRYIDGSFLRVAKGILTNRDGNYELLGRNFDVYSLAKTQKDIVDVNKSIELCDKLLNLTLKEYNNLVKLYYTEVQKKLIIDGYGYVFSGRTGWICINRCHLIKKKPTIDYKATKERKAKLIAEGKRLYNKEEAEWCKINGIEYKAEDGRVFQDINYVYEIPLINCKLPKGDDIKFKTADYRGSSIRGKRNEDLLKESQGDKNKICQYDVDIRTKLYICIEADDTLYNKFIRNETQKASVVR